MSTIPPPDRPTQQIRPEAPAPVVDQRVVAPAVDPNLILLRLEDTVRSLRTGLVFVGVIAVAALAVAIYALLEADKAGGRGSSRSGLASDARVSTLDDRVDRLSRQVQSARTGGGADADALGTRLDAVERTIKTLAGRPAGTDATQAVEQLSGRIDTLSRDVDALKQAPAAP